MPRIFDNIESHLQAELRSRLDEATRADFCVGYFNLRGWKTIDKYIDQFSGGDGACCRILIGMQSRPQDELREALSPLSDNGQIDNQTAIQLKREAAQEFRDQLQVGTPSNQDEATLRRLSRQREQEQLCPALRAVGQVHP